ncbi:MAG: type II and III secretion system protein [Endomicrobiia bacterium]|nr:type II and III secretion system protein [Endomicrobiia bacterium]
MAAGVFFFVSAPARAENEMIQITVEIVEVINSKARELGVKWADTMQSGEVMWQASGRQPEYLPEVPSVIKVGDWARWSPFTADLKMLVEKGAAKIMSKPKLLTKSGSEAKVLVGGAYPVAIAGIAGATGSIEWKEYGIRLIIKPVALPNKKISAAITTEVSRLDWANKVQGFPAIVTREATSEIIVNAGDTLTIAGLTESKKEEKIIGVPVLMDIPFLGELFKRKSYNDVESTVVIFVTPSYAN